MDLDQLTLCDSQAEVKKKEDGQVDCLDVYVHCLHCFK